MHEMCKKEESTLIRKRDNCWQLRPPLCSRGACCPPRRQRLQPPPRRYRQWKTNQAAQTLSYEGYTLRWEDTFDGTALNRRTGMSSCTSRLGQQRAAILCGQPLKTSIWRTASWSSNRWRPAAPTGPSATPPAGEHPEQARLQIRYFGSPRQGARRTGFPARPSG